MDFIYPNIWIDGLSIIWNSFIFSILPLQLKKYFFEWFQYLFNFIYVNKRPIQLNNGRRTRSFNLHYFFKKNILNGKERGKR